MDLAEPVPLKQPTTIVGTTNLESDNPLKRRSLLGSILLAGCATRPVPEGWHDQPLPGKTRSRYRAVRKDGREAIEAIAHDAASLWRRRLRVPASQLGEVSFSWWVGSLLPEASVADIDREDAVARVLFGFDGDPGRLSQRTRMQYELATLLTGETPPFATLMYVWDGAAEVGSVITNPRSERIKKIVLDSGPSMLGRWRDHRRVLRDDFQLAFGEPPGDLISVALMTDSDNTDAQARTWYGPVNL